MAVVHTPDSAYAKERVKWEAYPTECGPGKRTYERRDYPMMLHLAGPPASGLGAAEIVKTLTVGSEIEAESYRSQGFRPTPLEAIEYFAAQQLEFATLAAERNSEMRRMSERANAEVAAVEAAAGAQHLPTIPEQPVRKGAR